MATIGCHKRSLSMVISCGRWYWLPVVVSGSGRCCFQGSILIGVVRRSLYGEDWLCFAVGGCLYVVFIGMVVS